MGPDDTIWQHYIEQADKWDKALISGWNQGMDNLLLFATLFSAIVTAFLIESHKSLQQDNSQIAATGIIQIADSLQIIAAGGRPNLQNSTSQLQADFRPTPAAVAVNLCWFLSLSLSISVTLVALLVKQWGHDYQAGSGLIAHRAQAQIRQSRFDSLNIWKARSIVGVLPGVMHAALGRDMICNRTFDAYSSYRFYLALFLLGLLIFLWNLNHTVMYPVVIVVVFTLSGYLFLTVFPLISALCPYRTPLSEPGRMLWNYLCWLCLSETVFERNTANTPPGRKNEVPDSNITERAAGRAITWLIWNATETKVVDIAIQAIAGAKLPRGTWDPQEADSLITLMAQKFIACFSGISDEDIVILNSNSEQLKKTCMYGRALASVAKHKDLFLAKTPGRTSFWGDNTFGPQLTADEMQAVTRGFDLLTAYCSDPGVAAFGAASASAWYTYAKLPRIKWKETMVQSLQLVVLHIKGGVILDPDALANLMESLPIDISYWKQDLSKKDKRDVLLPLVELLVIQEKWTNQVRSGMSLVLAVLAVAIVDYPNISVIDEAFQWEHGHQGHQDLVAAGIEASAAYHHNPISRLSSSHSRRRLSSRVSQRAWRAQQAARDYTFHPHYRDIYTDSLLLVGLTGLLDSLDQLGLKDKLSEVASALARHLGVLGLSDVNQSLRLPLILPEVFDLRVYTVDCIVRKLRPSCYIGDQQHVIDDEAKAKLLASLSGRDRVWANFSDQLSLPVIEMLHWTNNHQLQKQCLIFLEERFQAANPSLLEWQVFSTHAVLLRLVQIIEMGIDDLSSQAASVIELFSQRLSGADNETRKPFSVVDILRSLTLDQLFETLVIKLICGSSSAHLYGWRAEIVKLPRILASSPLNSTHAGYINRMVEFCQNHTSQNEGNHLVLDLATELQQELDTHYPLTTVLASEER
ncbi:hypothetical protein FRC12_024679 [Ceratobasidium sp. 428]|nr:hypothetical protein FRC12_024679 [Ceratobasidium sp. 428]